MDLRSADLLAHNPSDFQARPPALPAHSVPRFNQSGKVGRAHFCVAVDGNRQFPPKKRLCSIPIHSRFLKPSTSSCANECRFPQEFVRASPIGDGVDVQTTTDAGGGYNVGFLRTGEWQEYTLDFTRGGPFKIWPWIRCSSESKDCWRGNCAARC